MLNEAKWHCLQFNSIKTQFSCQQVCRAHEFLWWRHIPVTECQSVYAQLAILESMLQQCQDAISSVVQCHMQWHNVVPPLHPSDLCQLLFRYSSISRANPANMHNKTRGHQAWGSFGVWGAANDPITCHRVKMLRLMWTQHWSHMYSK